MNNIATLSVALDYTEVIGLLYFQSRTENARFTSSNIRDISGV